MSLSKGTIPTTSTTTSSGTMSSNERRKDEHFVFIDDESLRAIGVLADELTPAVRKITPDRQQGLSIFKIFLAECSSKVGRGQLRQWITHPVRNMEILKLRQSLIEFFLDVEKVDLVEDLKKQLKKLVGISSSLRKIRTALLNFFEFNLLWTALLTSMEMCSLLEERLPADAPIVIKMQELRTQELEALVEKVASAVDFSLWKDTATFQVQPGFNTDLDRYKEVRAYIPVLVEKITHQEVQFWAQQGLSHNDFNVMYTEGAGFLMEVPVTLPTFLNAINCVSAHARSVFATNNASYFKTPIMEKTDATVKVVEEITRIEQEIQKDIQDKIISLALNIEGLVTFMAEIDCVISLATIAADKKWVKPQFNENNTIRILKGRHPLVEEAMKPSDQLESGAEFIPNDFVSRIGDENMKIITGPNGSGKTIYMKQVALIVHLALCGSFVPAEEASIPLVDQILTRIKTPATITNEASSFLVDLTQMKMALDEATEKSLVIIDEFGRGTRSEDGLCLLAACLDYFLINKNPHVLVATHMHSLKLLLPRTPSINFVQFTVEKNLCTSKFEPVFRVQNGPADSLVVEAIYDAVGLSLKDRALEVTQSLKMRKPLEPKFTDKQRQLLSSSIDIVKHFQKLNIRSASQLDTFMAQLKDIYTAENKE